MRKIKHKIICGDSLKILPKLPYAQLIWADPPDNIGCNYDEYDDCVDNSKYIHWLGNVIRLGIKRSEIFWLSYDIQWQVSVLDAFLGMIGTKRQFIWHYTFGQNNRNDFVRSFRPILRLTRPKAETYPESVYVPSARQTKYNDKRANSKGKMPDDVWEFPRVCGTFKERKKWHPCQHPKELLRRIVRFSTKPGDLVIDMFAGSGNMIEVCEEEGRSCIGIEISKTYCRNIKKDMDLWKSQNR